MQSEPREIEMQTYSFSYAYDTTRPQCPSYPWDDEQSNPVVFNNNFYSIPDHENHTSALNDSFDFTLGEDMKDLTTPESIFTQEAPQEMALELDPEEQQPEPELVFDAASQASTDVSATPIQDTMNIPQSANLDAQLDFIMESTKKKAKLIEKPSKSKRNRKTKEQLEILSRELSNKIGITKEKLKSVSKETGLKPLQVYKWYWDHKAAE